MRNQSPLQNQISFHFVGQKESVRYSLFFDQVTRKILFGIALQIGSILKQTSSSDSSTAQKYKPKVIVIELDCKTIQDLLENETAKYLCNLGYEIVAKNVILVNLASVVFVDKTFVY